MSSTEIMFGPYAVQKQVFYKTRLTFCLVNLMPILPGHVLVCPRRVIHRYKDMTPEEIADHAITVQKTARMIERVFKGTGLNIAIQDGGSAGQTKADIEYIEKLSVPHVHTHIIPRQDSDLERTDDIYDLMDGEEGNIGGHQNEARTQQEQTQQRQQWQKQNEKQKQALALEDSVRKPRSGEEMEKEARWLGEEMMKQEQIDTSSGGRAVGRGGSSVL